MDLANVIVGSVLTEKSERLKAARTHTLRIASAATKLEVRQALKKLYDVDVERVRVFFVRPKRRLLGSGRVMEKRHRWRKALVTLREGSRALDLASFRTNERIHSAPHASAHL
ncbi:50S ribosomal protein L23 [Candidatus Peregrinibacteria bacterium]|nr:50S ribosomal protein L23 [Candidatus Peregrinibacteria bacterium]